MSAPNDRKPEIPPQRKMLYNIGTTLMVLGGLLGAVGFITFVSEGMSSVHSIAINSGAPGDFMMVVIGMLLLAGGSIVQRVAARGFAGSGLVLDPEKARKDLHPYTHMAGGMVKDAVEAFRDGQSEPQEVIKVRCPHCKALNDETDKFCGQCGKEL